MSLTNVWVQTAADGLVRADQVVGIDAHQTPALSGKPARWLLDVVLPASIGSGTREVWGVSPLHRTLIQTAEDPTDDAATALARLFAQLDLVNAAGVITVSREDRGSPSGGDLTTGTGRVRFRFTPFPSPAPGHHTGAEYL